MKRYILGIVFSIVTIQSFASSAYRSNMQDYLSKNPLQQNSQPRVLSFNFKQMDITVLRNLLSLEKNVNLIIDPSVNRDQQFSIHLKNSNFLEFLEVTTQKFGLKYEVLNPRTIRVYR